MHLGSWGVSFPVPAFSASKVPELGEHRLFDHGEDVASARDFMDDSRFVLLCQKFGTIADLAAGLGFRELCFPRFVGFDRQKNRIVYRFEVFLVYVLGVRERRCESRLYSSYVIVFPVFSEVFDEFLVFAKDESWNFVFMSSDHLLDRWQVNPYVFALVDTLKGQLVVHDDADTRRCE